MQRARGQRNERPEVFLQDLGKMCKASKGVQNSVTIFLEIFLYKLNTLSRQIEVIPWIISDSNYVKSSSQKLDPGKTVFVGALHGQLTAEGLAKIMDELFEGVIYAGKWPCLGNQFHDPFDGIFNFLKYT